MKKCIIIVLTTLVLYSCAGLTTVPEAQRSFQHVYEVSGLSKTDIYIKAEEWFAKTYVSSSDVIKLSDESTGKIIGKGMTSYIDVMVSIPCRYTITFEAKENRFRITCDQYTGLYGEYRNMPKPVQYKAMVDEVNMKMQTIAEDLYNYIISSTKDSDW